MEMYGTDKPDTRFELKIQNLDSKLSGTEFNVFNNALKNNGNEVLKFYWIFPTDSFSEVEYFY